MLALDTYHVPRVTEALAARDLSKTYSHSGAPVHAVKQASFALQAGEFVTLRGRSGSGKSTILNLVGLLTQPDSGSIFIGGRDVSRLSDSGAADVRATSIGFVFQAFNLLNHLTAVENVTLPALAPAPEANRRAIELLERFGLAGRSHHLPAEMSGGEQQRVAAARALINKPIVLLADEPTGNLDAENETLILDQLRAAADDGCAVLVVSHSTTVASAGDRVLTINEGRIADPLQRVAP